MSQKQQAQIILLQRKAEELEARVIALEARLDMPDTLTAEVRAHSPGWFNVVDAEGNVLNASVMREDEATRFAAGVIA